MKIAVFANDDQWKDVIERSPGIEWLRMDGVNALVAADGFIILDKVDEFNFSSVTAPVFINAVTDTLYSLNAPENIIRINGWKGFLHMTLWEVAGKISPPAAAVLSALNKKHVVVADDPGFVSARVIAMIINEAWFALGEEISTKTDIDTAMKLGTNYPYGPFEWSEMIGVKNIYSLLQKLSQANKRCTPAPLLQKEASAWH